MTPRTISEKIWESHVVRAAEGEPDLLYIDLHLVHEVTSPQAFDGLRLAGRPVRRPDLTIATEDHNTPTLDIDKPIADLTSRTQIQTLRDNAAEFGIRLHSLGDIEQGIVHVVATQTLPLQEFKTMAITVEGELREGVTAKDIILAVIAQIGTGGGQGYVLEYRGSAIRSLSMEGRMTICNMSIEAGARAGMVAPDPVCYDLLEGGPPPPQGAGLEGAGRPSGVPIAHG